MPRVLGTCDTGWWKPLTSVEYKQCSIVSIIFLSVCLKNESNSDISWDQPWESWIVQYYFYFCYVGIQSCLFKLLKLRPKSTYLKLGLKSFSYIASCKEWEKVTYFDISWLIERKLTATPTGKYNYYTTPLLSSFHLMTFLWYKVNCIGIQNLRKKLKNLSKYRLIRYHFHERWKVEWI